MYELNYTEFSCLATLARNLEWMDSVPASLIEKKLVRNGKITDPGLAALEPYRVKRAVFLAAGLGSRMHPITVNTPKPLVRVHGKRIIETILDAVVAADIEEVIIVRGYLGEQFELLQKKYPMIRFIENEEYIGTGTIASVYRVREYLQNAYVLESDIVVNNPAVIQKYHYRSDYLGAPVPETDDWYLKTDDAGTIIDIGVNGAGDHLYKLVGFSYWNAEDGKKLKNDIEEAYHGPDGHKLSWSIIPFVINKDHYSAGILPCKTDDVTEIDSFRELQEFDPAYRIP